MFSDSIAQITPNNIVVVVNENTSDIFVKGIDWFSIKVYNHDVNMVIEKITSYINSMYVFNDTVETLEYYLAQMENDHAY